MTTVDLVINWFLVIVLLPLTVVSLMGGSKPPQNTFLTKYYQAEPYLMLASNIFLLTLCAISLLKLAAHYGLVGGDQSAMLDHLVMIPFVVLLVVFLGLFIRAILRVRRAERT